MRLNQVGDKADSIGLNIKSAEASATIPRGAPVILVLNAADDGLAVVLPSTAGAALSFNARLGVATTALIPSQFGESIAFGYVSYALITRMTRAASSDSWTSSASAASGIGLAIDTINNAFLLGASRAGSLVSAADNAWLVDSIASAAASATATSDTRTAITTGVRAFVRML